MFVTQMMTQRMYVKCQGVCKYQLREESTIDSPFYRWGVRELEMEELLSPGWERAELPKLCISSSDSVPELLCEVPWAQASKMEKAALCSPFSRSSSPCVCGGVEAVFPKGQDRWRVNPEVADTGQVYLQKFTAGERSRKYFVALDRLHR